MAVREIVPVAVEYKDRGQWRTGVLRAVSDDRPKYRVTGPEDPCANGGAGWSAWVDEVRGEEVPEWTGSHWVLGTNVQGSLW